MKRHITSSALTAEKRCRGRITTWNQSGSLELTLSVCETRKLQRRFFIDIDETIDDELMGKLLEHLRDEGTLREQEDLCLA